MSAARSWEALRDPGKDQIMLENAKRSMRQEIHRLQAQQFEMINEYGFIYRHMRVAYDTLMRDIKKLHNSIRSIEKQESES